MQLRLCEHFVEAIGAEAALEHAKDRLVQIEGRLAANDRQSPSATGNVAAWSRAVRALVEDVYRARARVSILAAIAGGKPPSEEPAIDAEERDRQLIRMAVAEGDADPLILAIALNHLAPRMGSADRVRQIERALPLQAAEYAAGRLTQEAYEVFLRAQLAERDTLTRRISELETAAHSIRVYLAAHAAGALGTLSEVVGGLHAVAILSRRKALEDDSQLKHDSQLKQLAATLADVEAETRALSHGGLHESTIVGSGLRDKKAAITSAVQERRAALSNAIGTDADALARKAAAGDPTAIEAVALVVMRNPGSFPAGLLGRILDVQVAALSTVPVAAVNALAGL
jgi:hypothetical protein